MDHHRVERRLERAVVERPDQAARGRPALEQLNADRAALLDRAVVVRAGADSSLPDELDLLLVDGPPACDAGHVMRRAPALPRFQERLVLGAAVVLDDIASRREREILPGWEASTDRRFALDERAGEAIGRRRHDASATNLNRDSAWVGERASDGAPRAHTPLALASDDSQPVDRTAQATRPPAVSGTASRARLLDIVHGRPRRPRAEFTPQDRAPRAPRLASVEN